MRSTLFAATLLLLFTSQPAEAKPRAKDPPSAGLHQATVVIEKEDLTDEELLLGFAQHVAAVAAKSPDRAASILTDYGWEGEAVDLGPFLGLQEKIHQLAVERAEQLQLAKKSTDSPARALELERAHTLQLAMDEGRLLGKWIQAMEGQGLDVRLLAQNLRRSTGFAMSRGWIDETPDIELEAERAKVLKEHATQHRSCTSHEEEN